MKKSSQKQKKFSQKEIKDFFKKMNDGGNGAPVPPPEQDMISNWITTDNSSKGDNNLITVAAWQVGQKS